MTAGYFDPVISIVQLRAADDADPVVFDVSGTAVSPDVTLEGGPAVLVVSEPTEALKMVDRDDVLGEPVDRSAMWIIDAVVLGREVLDRIDADELTIDDLLETVRGLGYEWRVVETSVRISGRSATPDAHA